jgi:hypothetical protein
MPRLVPAISEPLAHPTFSGAIVPAAGDDRHKTWGGSMAHPRAADDFATIRARMEELQRERAQAARGPEAERAF